MVNKLLLTLRCSYFIIGAVSDATTFTLAGNSCNTLVSAGMKTFRFILANVHYQEKETFSMKKTE